jgi:hypothetical protein
MAQLAADTGLGRESLYKALAPGAKPRYDTLSEICKYDPERRVEGEVFELGGASGDQRIVACRAAGISRRAFYRKTESGAVRDNAVIDRLQRPLPNIRDGAFGSAITGYVWMATGGITNACCASTDSSN